MKNLQLFLVAMFLISLEAAAQIENVRFSESLNFEKIYVGFDSKVIIPNDSLVAISSASLRLGSALTWDLDKSISIYTHGAIQWSNVHDPFAITAFILNVNVTHRLKLALGIPPTATTFTRAHPFTWRNQSESHAQSRIPGGKPGALLQYSLSDRLHVAYSFHNLDGRSWSNHLNITYGKFSIAGFVREDNSTFLSMRLNTNKIDANYNYSSLENEHNNSVFYNLTNSYTLFSDFSYRSASQELEEYRESEIELASFGIRRYLPDNQFHTGGFIAAAYDVVNKQTTFQLFLFLK